MAESHPPADSTLSLGEIAEPDSRARYEPRPGDGIGPYVLEEALGRGGMGQVFQAYEAKLDRRVAIKFVTVHHVTSVPRFVAEARVTARCTHPNIVVIHDISEHQGSPFMVLELLRGRPASQLVREGPLALDAVLEIMMQVARALHHAHKQGIVHRDLKPANIFVTDDDIVKVLDFGIAKLLSDPLDPGAPDAARLPGHTAVGQLVGTFEYMAPEQMTFGDVDHRADLWAFGLTLYQMLDGRRPYEGATELELLAHARDLGAPMPRLADRRPDLPVALTSLVDACLAKRPADRPADAASLVRGLRAARAASGLTDEPLSDPARSSPASSALRLAVVPPDAALPGPPTVVPPRSRAPVIAPALALVALLAAGAAWRWWPRPAATSTAASDAAAAAQVARLTAELDRLLATGDRAGAAALVQAFVGEPDHRRSPAAALAWQAWGERLHRRGDGAAALDAFAQAYLAARDDRARLAPLEAIAELHLAARSWQRLGDVLAVLADIPGGDAVARRPRMLHDLAQGVGGAAERVPARWRPIVRALAAGAPGPTPVRRIARVQLDGDRQDELLSFDGARVTASDLGAAITRRFDLPSLGDLRCATNAGDGFVVVGGSRGGHNVLRFDRAGHEVSSRAVAGWQCNAADRDGDGDDELYVYGNGSLVEVMLGDGGDLAGATLETWSLGSEVGGVTAVEHGGGRSLLLSASEWRGYDLRMVDVAADHTLRLRDRVRLGLVTRARPVRRPGKPLLHATLVEHNYPSRKALGAAAPAGSPQGLYLFEIGPDALLPRGRIEVPTDSNATLVVADLDGDGADELMVSACPDERCLTTVFVLNADDTVERFWLNGLEVIDRVDADPDAADEVAAIDDERRLWVLGTGTTAVPRRGQPAPPTARPPPGLAEAGAQGWQRAEDLARIGLTDAAATSFATLRSLSTDVAVQDAALERAATLRDAGGDAAAAAAAWAELASARTGAAAASARLRAIEAHHRGGDLAAARALADAVLADGVALLSPTERLALDGLRDELAAPAVTLVEAGRPHDAWRVVDPTGFYLDPAGGGLVIDSTTPAPVIAAAGVRHGGGPLRLRFDITMTRTEWAGEISLALVPRAAPTRAVYMGLRGGGGGQATRRLGGLSGPSAYIQGAFPLRSVDEAVRARLTVTRVAGDRVRVRWDVEGAPSWEQSTRVSVPPGDYDLQVITANPGDVASGVAKIHELSLVGFEVLPRADVERAAAEAAAALARNDGRATLAALERNPPADRWEAAKLRALALQLLGRGGEARAVLRDALAAEGPRRRARIDELAWLRRVRDGQFAALALAAAGDDRVALEAMAWKATGYQHLHEPRVQERLAAELVDLPEDASEARAQLHLLRGTALSVMKRTDEARAELERAFATGTAAELRQEAAVQLAVDAAAAGDAALAHRWAEQGLDVANDPLWVADQLLLDPAIRALATRPEWERVRQHGRIVMSGIRTIDERVSDPGP